MSNSAPVRLESPQQSINLQLNGKPFSFLLAEEGHWEGWLVYEQEVIDAMARFVKPGDAVIDAGANIGFFSMLLSFLVGETGVVAAFEPDPENCVILRKNIDNNHIQNVYSFYQALWSHDCPKYFYPYKHGGYSSLVMHYNESKPPMQVMVRSLDSLFVKHRLANPKLIKVDCEGAEEDILRGAEQMLRRGVDCVIAEINFHIIKQVGDPNRTDRTLRNFMQGLGYDVFLLEPGCLPTYIHPECVITPVEGKGHINVMFTKREKVEALWKDGGTVLSF